MANNLLSATPDGGTPPVLLTDLRQPTTPLAHPEPGHKAKAAGVPLQFPLPTDSLDTLSATVDIAVTVPVRPKVTNGSGYTQNDLNPEETHPLTELTGRYLAALLQAERETAETLILDSVAAGTSIRDIYLHVFQMSQRAVGRLWETGEISVAQEHYCTAATQMIMTQLYPQIFSTARNGYRLVAACADHEHHEIGIRMVADFFEMEGWDTHYLGANVGAEALIDAVVEHQAHMIALSATLTTSIHTLPPVISALRADPRTAHIPILVGGFGFHQIAHRWQDIGADGYAVNAQEAVQLAQSLLDSASQPTPFPARSLP